MIPTSLSGADSLVQSVGSITKQDSCQSHSRNTKENDGADSSDYFTDSDNTILLLSSGAMPLVAFFLIHIPSFYYILLAVDAFSRQLYFFLERKRRSYHIKH